MAKTRAIRFSDAEEKLIQEFLDKNPIFDFSTMARTAVRQFILNPTVPVTAVSTPQKTSDCQKKRSTHA